MAQYGWRPADGTALHLLARRRRVPLDTTPRLPHACPTNEMIMTIRAMNLLPLLVGGGQATWAFHCHLSGLRSGPRPPYEFSGL